MKGFELDTFALLTIFCIGFCTGGDDLSRGWNDKISWVKFDDGEKLAQKQNQPMMLVIHKSWCGACKSLKPQFAASKQIEELSKEFVMVNTLDDEEPNDSKFAPDGGYIPRILFRDSAGNVLTDIYNEQGNDKYKYYYHNPEHILASMRRCLEKVKDATRTGSGEL